MSRLNGPPVYRPTTALIAQRSSFGTAVEQRAAPPVYRPQQLQSSGSVSQPKLGQARAPAPPVFNPYLTVQRFSTVRPRMAAPPVYRPNQALQMQTSLIPAATTAPARLGRGGSITNVQQGLRRVQQSNMVQAAPSHTASVALRAALQGNPVRSFVPAVPISVGRGTAVQLEKVSYSKSPQAQFVRRERRKNNHGGNNLATVKYKVLSTGATYYKTLPSNKRHSEGQLYDWLEKKHPADYKVEWLYSELEPCGRDYHDCASRVEAWFPGAKIYWSIDYASKDEVSSGDETDAAEREAEKRAKAKRRRAKSSGLVKRLDKKLKVKSSGDEMEVRDFRGGIRSIYSPHRNDGNLDPGYKL
jgi:hypothetical protein